MKSIHEQIAGIRLLADALISSLERNLFPPDPADILNLIGSVPSNDTDQPFEPVFLKRFNRKSTEVVEVLDAPTGETDEQFVERTNQVTGKAASA
jgi:hypothetical protein